MLTANLLGLIPFQNIFVNVESNSTMYFINGFFGLVLKLVKFVPVTLQKGSA